MYRNSYATCQQMAEVTYFSRSKYLVKDRQRELCVKIKLFLGNSSFSMIKKGFLSVKSVFFFYLVLLHLHTDVTRKHAFVLITRTPSQKILSKKLLFCFEIFVYTKISGLFSLLNSFFFLSQLVVHQVGNRWRWLGCKANRIN